MKYEDPRNDLLRWAKENKKSGLFEELEKDVQEAYRQISDYVEEKYRERPAKVAEFLSGGDGWIIAHALCDGGIVVSHENRLDSTALIPKIPNVCRRFGVGCIDLPTMLKALKFTFGA